MKTDVFFSSESTEYWTPRPLFAQLHREFKFTLDACATRANACCRRFFSLTSDGLAHSWAGEVVFMNPPYGRKVVDRWVAKAYAENDATVVCLLPARTETVWWHTYVMRAQEIRFVCGRVAFSHPGRQTWTAPFPSVLVVFRKGMRGTIASKAPALSSYIQPAAKARTVAGAKTRPGKAALASMRGFQPWPGGQP
jgi:site-specific DNA-methyltransferase (adenine-specific)